MMSDPSAPALQSAPSPRLISKRRPRQARTRGYWQGRPLVVGARLFRDVLARERCRAARFGESFVLVVVTRHGEGAFDTTWWRPVVETLSAEKRDTDVLGWIAQGSTLGLIVPEIGSDDTSFARDVASRMRHAMTAALDGDHRESLSVRVHRHAATSQAAGGEAASIPVALNTTRNDAIHALLKRTVDIAASALLLFLLSPILAAVALLVRLWSPGPVLFRQERIGQFGRPFTMLKFRTMHADSDASIHRAFMSQFIKAGRVSKGTSSESAPFKLANDPRVTSIGQILRTTSLDELPQLWNVLRGDMSLVGPRPALQYEVAHYKPWQNRRVLDVKPGITGLWQVSGRSRTTFDDMVRLDLRYAKNPSMWTDIKILLATPRAVISGKGAC
jgi:exopolysaccharide biosynthesis polyprenyl glycosylphosphotransferase